jgi:hypothetical protein
MSSTCSQVVGSWSDCFAAEELRLFFNPESREIE